MRLLAVISLVCLVFLVRNSTADSPVQNWSFDLGGKLDLKINSTGYFDSFGGSVGWKISWNLNITDFVQIGPFTLSYNDGTPINDLEPIYIGGNGNWTESIAMEYKVTDPCVHRMPRDTKLLTNLQLRSNMTYGMVNVTEYREPLTVVGQGPNSTNVSLNCNVECRKFVLFNTTTDLKNFTMELTIKSGIKVFMTYSYGLFRCPSIWGYPNTFIYPDTPAVIQVYNQTQIWIMFSVYQLTDSEKDNIVFEWKAVPGEVAPDNNDDTVKMILIGGAIAIVVALAIAVVVTVIRKKRSDSYTQIQ